MRELVENHGWQITPKEKFGVSSKCNHLVIPFKWRRHPFVRHARATKLLSYWIIKGKKISTLCGWIGMTVTGDFSIENAIVNHETKIEYRG